MQTFLPYSDFAKSAACLDDKRLGKQRVEAFQVIQCLTGRYDSQYRTAGWRHHPVVCQWDGHITLLKQYYHAMLKEWILRGYENNMQFFSFPERYEDWASHLEFGVWPPWLGMETYHASHRATLLAKNPEWYGQFGWREIPRYQYFWPITISGYGEWGPATEIHPEGGAVDDQHSVVASDTAAGAGGDSLDQLAVAGATRAVEVSPYWERYTHSKPNV